MKSLARHIPTIVLAALLLAFIGYEIHAQRQFSQEHDNIPFYEYRHHLPRQFTPYGMVEYKPESRIVLRGKYETDLFTDKYGFIRNSHSATPDIGEHDFLIFLVGGSTVEGRGVSSPEKTAAAQLERVLREKTNKDIRVVNAGGVGYVSYQQLQRITGRLFDFKPDMIIELDGRNDIYYGLKFPGWRPDWHPYFEQISHSVNKMMNASFPDKAVFYGMDLLYHLSRSSVTIYRLFGKRIDAWMAEQKEKRDLDFTPDAGRVDLILRSYIENHRVAQLRAENRGVAYYAFLQPTLTYRSKKYLSEEEEKTLVHWQELLGKNNDYFSLLDSFYQSAGGDTSNYPWFFDISGVFLEVKKAAYVDNCHYNDFGNAIIAEKIASVILPEIQRELA